MILRFIDSHTQAWDTVVNFVHADGRRWYLAGGTALSLYLAHRDSEDLDLFIHENFDADELADLLDSSGYFAIDLVEENTVNCFLDETRVQFLGVPAQTVLAEPHIINGLAVASMKDIMAMKMAAVTGRAKLRDYVDIMEIDVRGGVSVELGLSYLVKRFHLRTPDTTVRQIVSQLGYLDDLDDDPLAGYSKSAVVDFWSARAQKAMMNLITYGLPTLETATPENQFTSVTKRKVTRTFGTDLGM